MYIAITCFPGCDVINFEINLIFPFQPFFYMTKKSRQKFKCLEKEKSFQGEIKSIFLSFLKGFQLPKIVSDLRLGLQTDRANVQMYVIVKPRCFYSLLLIHNEN